MHQPNIEDIPMTTKTFLPRTTCFPVPDQVSTYPLRTFLTRCPASSTDLNELHLTSCTARPIWSNRSNQIGVETVTRRMQIVQLSIHLRQLGTVILVISSYPHVSTRCRHSVFLDDAVYERGGVSNESLAKNFAGITNILYLTTGLEILRILGLDWCRGIQCFQL